MHAYIHTYIHTYIHSYIHWLCLLRRNGRKEITGTEDFFPMEKQNLVTYVMKSNEKLFGVMGKGMEHDVSGKQYKEGSMGKI